MERNIDTIRDKKRDLEKNIRLLCEDFYKETLVKVKDVEVWDEPIGYDEHRLGIIVKLEDI